MSPAKAYISENSAELEHLKTLVARLTDEELSRPLDAGWSVSAVLAHLAFWDQRALVLLRKWKREGIGTSLIDVDVVNEVTRLLCLAIAPRAAANLSVLCAQAIDQEIEQLSDEMTVEVEEKGKTVKLNRAEHRREHLTQIEKALYVK